MSDAVQHPITKIPHHGKIIRLRSPASQTLRLPGVAAAATLTESKVLAWVPEDKQANQLEVRARIVGTTATIGLIPVVRWRVEDGHGTAVWREPQPTLSQIAGTPMREYSLPARGLAWRLTGREFRVSFRNDGALAGGPIAEVVVQVTINPVYGSVVDTYPYQHLAGPVTGGIQEPFPMTAREFKLTGADGLPVPAGPGLLFVGVAGGLFAATAASSYADWTPIPHDARGYVVSAPFYAAYR